MYKFITFKCSNCHSVIFNLPNDEAIKLEGMSLFCDCCDHKIEINTMFYEKRFA